ncbi:MAG: SCP2 sterol-binding domain-containing protein [Thermoanaerobaculia bacterium]|nr:SCP2 sterol-binding domain-containing protein [Thermoanaerobaculia bacterium]
MKPDASSFDAPPPSPELFGPEWAERLERELAANEPYRAAAASWKGSLAFDLQPDGTPGFPAGRGLFLDLAHGSCRAARPALPGDLESASFCLSGPAAVWLRLLSGDLEPGAALMGGGLKLTRGSFFSLLPHLRAAQALLECARLVPTHMPAAGI